MEDPPEWPKAFRRARLRRGFDFHRWFQPSLKLRLAYARVGLFLYMRKQKGILKFLHEAEKLKTLLRHSWLSNGRRESVAEHSWRMALMAVVFYPYLQKKNRPNLEKTLMMILAHDLPEIYATDVPAWKKFRQKSGWRKKRHKSELAALKKLIKTLGKNQQRQIIALWEEFELGRTKEAKLAQVLDKMEANFQHNEALLKTWNKGDHRIHFTRGVKEAEYDEFLKAFRELGNKEARRKIKIGK
ncbi:MAG: HAD family hydrolase [Candidatus Doudnabacteria bacterium CG10_big_fil_rev_8_21_14_0_10_42_18]|uniref:5'-deoxynucleotidase n=1 Tax=Candidatus Doudnabacteria bacterium CG10_big_fil_rev_8_21_14_0_10_42_18 TaxID=1974552 RepID=A0A2H0VCF8_9BACT|nr:MAG: HAD family hydrolase [Candidatus Doudnabacteria bacterium CG10_big_fil_rev_8_21_14_0_10_42_18]